MDKLNAPFQSTLGDVLTCTTTPNSILKVVDAMGTASRGLLSLIPGGSDALQFITETATLLKSMGMQVRRRQCRPGPRSDQGWHSLEQSAVGGRLLQTVPARGRPDCSLEPSGSKLTPF